MSTIDIDPRKGSTSASNAQADLLCPGRHLKQKEVQGKDKPRPDAEFGRRIHLALADGTDRSFIESLTLEERDIFDACRAVEKKKLLEFFGTEHPPMRVYREQADGTSRIWCKVPDPNSPLSATTFLQHSGQPDVVFVAGSIALIEEYKTLPGDVPESPRNQQLRDQVVLANGRYGPFTMCGVFINQPLVNQDPLICVYNPEQIQRAEAEMFERVINSNDPASGRVAGDLQCKFCRAAEAGICAEYQKWAGALVPIQLNQVLEIPMANWSPEQRAHAANQLSAAEKFLENIKAFLKEGLTADPNFVPGWALKPGNKRETIRDPQKVFERFSMLGGTVEQFMRTVTIGKGRLKEELAGVSGAKGKALDMALGKLCEGVIETSQNAPSLKKVDE